MIPLRDENPTRSTPAVTLGLIALNVAIFVWQRYFGPLGYEGYLNTMGMIPARLTGRAGAADPAFLWAPATLLTGMFMHGGWLHLIGNMWFLWIFGDNIEDRLGRVRYLLFYFVTGGLSFLAHVAIEPSSRLPLVGASGAIAGVLGGYFLLFPRHHIVAGIIVIFYFTTVRVPAFFFLGFWFLMQFLYSLGGGQVAWYAHIGGFVAGLVLVRFFLRR
jgi:membrane associated rhomboid family serine protease